MRYDFGGLIFGGAYTWRGLFSEFYGMSFRSVKGPKELINAFYDLEKVEKIYVPVSYSYLKHIVFTAVKRGAKS